MIQRPKRQYRYCGYKALNELTIRGDVHTTVEHVEDLLRTEDFINNAIHTGWLDARLADEHDAQGRSPGAKGLCGRVVCGNLLKPSGTNEEMHLEESWKNAHSFEILSLSLSERRKVPL